MVTKLCNEHILLMFCTLVQRCSAFCIGCVYFTGLPHTRLSTLGDFRPNISSEALQGNFVRQLREDANCIQAVYLIFKDFYIAIGSQSKIRAKKVYFFLKHHQLKFSSHRRFSKRLATITSYFSLSLLLVNDIAGSLGDLSRLLAFSSRE